MHELLQVVIISVVEGLTEFIPVSSTGHIILVSDLINFSIANKESFSIFIQLGAILSVLVLYRSIFTDLLTAFKNKPLGVERLSLVHICIAALPVFIVGFFGHAYIKAHLFSATTVAWALIFGGVVLVLLERLKKPEKLPLQDVSLKQAFLVGLFQCFSLWPGISRSGATITGGILAGLDRRTAAEFSFIVAVPVMFVATAYDMYKVFHLLQRDDLSLFTIGFLLSFIFALLAIRVFLKLLERVSLAVFGVYRILLGIIVLLLIGS